MDETEKKKRIPEVYAVRLQLFMHISAKEAVHCVKLFCTISFQANSNVLQAASVKQIL